MMRYWLLFTIFFFYTCKNTDSSAVLVASPMVSADAPDPSTPIPAAEQLQLYYPRIKDKRVALVVNHASMVGDKHLLDTLQMMKVEVVKIFAPEHGFRGQEDAGADIQDEVDRRTGVPIVSLYGQHKKPSAEALKGVETVIFDLQDVGVRCYTYLSTLHYVMEACAENEISLIVLDRPNPNGHYVDGPVLQKDFSSFVGLHPVPLVYGMTIGEYAKMIKGEKWIHRADTLDLTVVPCASYHHHTRYSLPIAPSPNLPTYRSVLLYPSLVLFEGTPISVGRGTAMPFEVFGHPDWTFSSYAFFPKPGPGAQNPKHNGKACGGVNLQGSDPFQIRQEGRLNLGCLMNAYEYSKMGTSFFNSNLFFDKLAGTDQLRQQILSGSTEEEIRASWADDLRAFSAVREKYLMYD